ncbi:MAG: Phenylalanine--tRNA ligase beta subunit, partial [Candidatus Saccharibacteria bacterium]|nr:Phenylalanine--tRNA ligase beta subunit [Candidatus Saccharibacteria bacterium]
DISYMALQDFVEAELAKLGPDNTSFNISPIGIYQKAEDQDYKQITLRLSIASYERTLTDTEVNKLLEDIAAGARQELNAERV